MGRKERATQLDEHAPTGPDRELVGALTAQLTQDIAEGSVPPPPMSQSALEAERSLRTPEPDLEAATTSVEEDLTLTVALLSVANSALFRRGREITTVGGALRHVGPRVAHQLVYTAVAKQCYTPSHQRTAEVLRPLWERTQQLARLAREVAETIECTDRAGAYLGALLRDIGIPTVAAHVRRLESKLRKDSTAPLSLTSWRALTQQHHSPVSHATAVAWNAPDSVLKIQKGRLSYDAVAQSTAGNAVRFADAMLEEAAGADDTAFVVGQAVLQLDEDTIQALRERAVLPNACTN